jgi:hypothetical protein
MGFLSQGAGPVVLPWTCLLSFWLGKLKHTLRFTPDTCPTATV